MLLTFGVFIESYQLVPFQLYLLEHWYYHYVSASMTTQTMVYKVCIQIVTPMVDGIKSYNEQDTYKDSTKLDLPSSAPCLCSVMRISVIELRYRYNVQFFSSITIAGKTCLE